MNRYPFLALITAVGGLIALGLVTLFGAEQVSRFASFQRHLCWVAIGVVGGCLLARIDYRHWQRWAVMLFWIAAFLLMLCFAPGIGKEINSAHRWIALMGVQFQPSEVAKLACILFLAAWYTKHVDKAGSTWFGFIWPGLAALLLAGLIAPQVDIGAATLLAAVTGIVMLMAGVRYRWLILGLAGSVAAVTGAVKLLPERSARFLAFMEPEKHAQGDAWQQLKALEAFGVGGWDGVGLGSVLDYVQALPYLESDFIFPVIGGELGLQVSLLVVLAYVIIMVSGIIISLNAPDRFGMLLGSGVVGMMVIQAIIHMAVTTMMMPNTGLPLPFVSQGGTNLLVCFACVGLLLSIHRQAWAEPESVTPRLEAQLRITPRL